MSVTVEVTDGPNAQVPWSSGMNVQNALELAYGVINNSQKFTYGLQYYGSGLGYMVFMINETFDSFVSSSAPFYYWELFVNHAPAATGIDNTPLNNGDVVTFTFSLYAAAAHAGSFVTAKHKHQTSSGS